MDAAPDDPLSLGEAPELFSFDDDEPENEGYRQLAEIIASMNTALELEREENRTLRQAVRLALAHLAPLERSSHVSPEVLDALDALRVRDI